MSAFIAGLITGLLAGVALTLVATYMFPPPGQPA